MDTICVCGHAFNHHIEFVGACLKCEKQKTVKCMKFKDPEAKRLRILANHRRYAVRHIGDYSRRKE